MNRISNYISSQTSCSIVPPSEFNFEKRMTALDFCVFQGTSLMTESTILDLPTAVCTFHMDVNEPRTPGNTFKLLELCFFVLSGSHDCLMPWCSG